MEVLQTPSFIRTIKKLRPNQKKDLDKAVKALISNPQLGKEKVGDLSKVRVYKFKMAQQLSLLAYSWEEERLILTLLAIGTHENFYRDLKRSTGPFN